jgi:UDP-N-acetylglucosamine 2-epimerase (non-hydrolysing)
VQEEAPALAKPVLVLRNTTERPEGVAYGVALLVGTEPRKIVSAASTLLQDDVAYNAMAWTVNPYGDGAASRRTVEAVLHYFGLREDRPADFVPAKGVAASGGTSS